MASYIKTIALSFLAIFGVRTEEQPPFRVIDRIGEIEIRQYNPRFSAEVTVPASDENAARSEAFRILAGYIFGKNKDKRDIAMTAAVTTEQGRQIAMTAPVETKASGSSSMTMRFFLPADVTASDAPSPLDPRVKLVELQAETIAALRFSGSWSPSTMYAKHQQLLDALQGSPWQPDGQEFSLFYDPPFTLPFLRRNEAAVRVKQQGR